MSVEITQSVLNSINVEQQKEDNKDNLDKLGGVDGLAKSLGLNPDTGLTKEQVEAMRAKFGKNVFPETPMDSFFMILLNALSDTTLVILMIAAGVSIVITMAVENNPDGWIEGTAIFIAVALVSSISSFNDYSKQLQFQALEHSAQKDERTSVFRDGNIERINPSELVVGDIIVIQAGDMIPADSVMLDHSVILSNESSLTGETNDLKKSRTKDCFLLSSCLITDGEQARAVVIGIGPFSQWGKIKANLVTESVNTPLQDKLMNMTNKIGIVGVVFAVMIFIVTIIDIFVRHGGEDMVHGIIEGFILAVTVVVVAIPEGLPLAVVISLAYSTKKMYQDQCFIRVLAACETMGNATNICSDKTGTLTENVMTVVEGWFADVKYSEEEFGRDPVPQITKDLLADQISINRSAYLITVDPEGNKLEKPAIIGNKTEGALILMMRGWGYDYEEVKNKKFNDLTDKAFAFNSTKKRSTAVIHNKDGSVRLFCKGASEIILSDCTSYIDQKGVKKDLTTAKKAELEDMINGMAKQALRTLALAHKDFNKASDLPSNWAESPPDDSKLCLECIVGIKDPLRSDVKEAVRVAQAAGVIVRMVTGDNIATASAIAKQCGILTDKGMAIEGPKFRKMTPKELDAILSRLQVVARSSPHDKYILVTRLNGYALPTTKEEWIEKYKDREGADFDQHKDLFLPGYYDEWEATRPFGGDVVGVTGDGTNDAPALKAADVGLSMGITGTKVAQGASDIVILDDKFGSIVNAIKWGRTVYDNVRKFLQFQLTVNCVALIVIFTGAAAGFGQPLNSVQLLWVNLIMDTLGALALGTELPTPNLLERKPYKRSAPLIGRTMMRNIFVQACFQLAMLFTLLFAGPSIFGIEAGITCAKYKLDGNVLFDASNFQQTVDPSVDHITCAAYTEYCSGKGIYCLKEDRSIVTSQGNTLVDVSLSDFDDFESDCLACTTNDYTHGSIIFNGFIFCQVFNEYNSRKLFDELNAFTRVFENPIFVSVTIVTIGLQILLIEEGGEFLKTTPLTINQWLITVAMAAIGLIFGVLQRFIPVKEDPADFFDHSRGTEEEIALYNKDHDDHHEHHPHPNERRGSKNAFIAPNYELEAVVQPDI